MSNVLFYKPLEKQHHNLAPDFSGHPVAVRIANVSRRFSGMNVLDGLDLTVAQAAFQDLGINPEKPDPAHA